MRILHIINSLGVGGAEKLIADTLPKLKDKGVDVELLVLKTVGSKFESDLIAQGIVLHSLEVENIYNPIVIIKIRAYLKNYDIVHVHLFPAQYWVVLSTMFFKSPPLLITTEHSTTNRRRSIALLKYIDRFVYNRYQTIIGISKGTSANLNTHLGGKNKIVTVENGVDLNKFYHAKSINKEKFGFKSTDVVLTMVAGFKPAKDQDTVIKSLSLLPNNVKLLLVGDGVRKHDCMCLAKSSGVEDRVCFLGVRNDIADILKSSDICVVSSHWEGFGLVAVEGMAVGKPILASNVSGLRDVVDDSDLLFTVGDYEMLASKVIDLISDKELYHMKSISCQKNAEKYSLDKMVGSSIKLYKEMLK